MRPAGEQPNASGSPTAALAPRAALAPVILKTIEGLAGTREVLLDVGRSFKVTPSQQFWKILLPAALRSGLVVIA